MARHVVLVGPMGSGKSTIGRALSGRLGVGHVDTDEIVVARADLTIPELFDREGETGFRAREAEALREALSGAPAVISTGGGIVMTPANRELLASGGSFVVWLDAALEELLGRVGDGTGRPLLTGDVATALEARIAERAPHYAAVADLRLDTGARAPDACVDAIVTALDPAAGAEVSV